MILFYLASLYHGLKFCFIQRITWSFSLNLRTNTNCLAILCFEYAQCSLLGNTLLLLLHWGWSLLDPLILDPKYEKLFKRRYFLSKEPIKDDNVQTKMILLLSYHLFIYILDKLHICLFLRRKIKLTLHCLNPVDFCLIFLAFRQISWRFKLTWSTYFGFAEVFLT